MPAPSDSALRARARTLLEAMTERARWIYAVPRDPGGAAADPAAAGEAGEPGEAGSPSVRPPARAMLEARGLRCEDEDAGGRVARYANDRGDASFVVFDSPELGVLLLEAEGSGAPPILGEVLAVTGFLAQSELLRTALDVQGSRAGKALRVLAHMVVAWDEDWSDLFLLHLASPDPVARHEATLAVSVAALVARDPGPTKALLDEARRRERFPKLRETMDEALRLIEAMTGGPVEITPDAGPGDDDHEDEGHLA